MTDTKTLPVNLGDVITAYSGKMFTPGGKLHGLRNMLQFMVNRQLLIPQLPRAADTVRPTLAQRFDWLVNLELPDLRGLPKTERDQIVPHWLDDIACEHGAVLHVPQLPEGLWIDMDPIAETREMMPNAVGYAAVVMHPGGDAGQVMVNPPPGAFRNPRLDEIDEPGGRGAGAPREGA